MYKSILIVTTQKKANEKTLALIIFVGYNSFTTTTNTITRIFTTNVRRAVGFAPPLLRKIRTKLKNCPKGVLIVTRAQQSCKLNKTKTARRR